MDVMEIHARNFSTSEDTIVGSIYVQCQEYCFPQRDWVDLPEKILVWWLGNVSSLLLREDAEVELIFAEGPYFLWIDFLEYPDHLRIRFCRDHTKRQILETVQCGTGEFVRSLFAACEVLDEYARSHGLVIDRDFNSNKRQLIKVMNSIDLFRAR